jgi:hypothetical protein
MTCGYATQTFFCSRQIKINYKNSNGGGEMKIKPDQEEELADEKKMKC